ncbi:MAG: TRAFAC clade GTPase domain-containing protein, partial [Ktedonobacterales bacterium]
LWVSNQTYARVYRIFVRCPACFTTVPVATYICPQCGVEHSRLWPSVYGVLHHKCTCKKARLATLDRLGRSAYRPICPKCKTPLPGIGVGTNVHLPVVGGPYAGKTNYIVTATRELIDSYGRTHGYDVSFVNQLHANEYQERLRQLSSGQVLLKTADLRPQAYNLRIKKQRSHGVPKLTYVYDPAGEVFGNIAHTTEQGYYEYIDGIVFILDPFAIPAYRARHQAEVDQYRTSIRPSDMDVELVYSRFIEALESLKSSRGVGVGMSNGQPLAVVVTKVDACGLEQEIGSPAARIIMAKDPSIGVEQDAISLLVRQFLIANNLGNFVRDAESQFHNVKYFSCSALGRMPGPGLSAGFTSTRVADPLVWLLGNARALNTRAERVRLVDAHDRMTRKRIGSALNGLTYYHWKSLKAGRR